MCAYFRALGSMVPFSLRVIHAELPQHNGKPNESLDRLYNLLNMVRTIIQNLEQGYSEEGAEDVQMTEEERKG